MGKYVIKFLTDRRKILDRLDSIVSVSNQERDALGWLPEGAYRDFAYQGQIIVAIDDFNDELAGYSIFAGALPTAKLRQTYVAPSYRRTGLGGQLVDAAVLQCQKLGYLSIKATVARDLVAANAFYEKQGFGVVAQKAGGKTRNRVLLIRVRQLDTPSLFDFTSYTGAGEPIIRLELPKSGPAPLYLLDLNVLFDVIRRPERRAVAQNVFSAALESSVRLAVSGEFLVELERSTADYGDDPMLQLARALPIVPKPNDVLLNEHFDDIARLIFPSRHELRNLTDRDRSDITHIATAVVENVAGFITSEKAILKKSLDIREKYSIDIVSPTAFGADEHNSTGGTLEISVVDREQMITSRAVLESDQQSLHAFASRLGVAAGEKRAAYAQGTSTSPRSRVIVLEGETIIAFASWQVGAKDEASAQIHLFVDDQAESGELAADHLIDLACRAISVSAPSIVWLRIDTHRALVRNRAMHFGFQPSGKRGADHQRLQKVALGQVVFPEKWSDTSKMLSSSFGLNLPMEAPSFDEKSSELEVEAAGGFKASIRIEALEDFLAPSLLALAGRPAIIVPIWPRYVEALFQGSAQPALFAGRRAGLSPQKCYLSDPASIKLLPEHGLIVFYESGGPERHKGRSAAVAIGRIQRRYLATEEAALGLAQIRGVLSQEEVRSASKNGSICVTEFDNLMRFRSPVPLATLKKMGCADGANLVTGKRLETAALLKLIEAGAPHAAPHV